MNKHILFFTGEHCNACKQLEPRLRALTDIKIEVHNRDYAKNRNMIEYYEVCEIPCVILFQENIEKSRMVGSVSDDKIKAFLEC